MAFCAYCGSELTPGARFCASCGSPVDAALPGEVSSDPIPVMPQADPGPADYSVILYSIGTCAKSYADDVLEDILGYTDSEAKRLLRLAPTQIAQALTGEQAQYIAQALTEYGMQVLIYRGNSPVDLGQYAGSSVFNSDGTFVAAAMASLATLSLANRIRAPRRWTLGDVLHDLFRPRYHYAPPRHITRAPIRREPMPRAPEPRRVSMPRRMEPQRRSMDVPRSVQLNRDTRSGGPRPGGSKGGPGGGRGPGGPGSPGGRR